MGYDHVVVGAGSSGATLAARLADDDHRSVLLLEAGPDHRTAATPPGIAGPDLYAALATPGRRWDGPYARGRGVGGSSAVNGMLAEVGPASDYDAWGDGWRAVDLAPSFARARQRLAVRPAAPTEVGALNAAARAAATHLGLSARTVDLAWNGHRRVTTNDAYLEPAHGRTNLTVRGDTEVSRIRIETNRATGVELSDGEMVDAEEVIVCAGALGTPALLRRSGVHASGIGRNLRDHIGVAVPVRRRTPHTSGLVTATLVDDGDVQIVPLEATGVDAVGRAHGALLVTLMANHAVGELDLEKRTPTVRFPSLDHGADRAALQRGVRTALQLARELGPDFEPEEPDLDQPGGVYHAVGTCRMGDVVDRHGRVIGYDGLRVADASIMPTLPRANPYLTCVTIGEHIAELMRSAG